MAAPTRSRRPLRLWAAALALAVVHPAAEMAAAAPATPPDSGASIPEREPHTSETAARPTAPARRPVPFDKRWLEPYFRSGPANSVVRQAVERFRTEDWAQAVVLLTRALKALPPTAAERHPTEFLLALALMNQNEWADAGTHFEDLFGSYPRLAPYHAYYAARCRLRRGDAAGALTWSERVPSQTVPSAETQLVRLDALAALGRYDEVARESARYVETYKQGPRRAEAQFHWAEALERLGRPATESVPIYRRIWAEAPLESWASRAEARIAALTDASSPLRTASASDLVSRGMVFFDRNQNAESEAAFTAALTAPGLDPALECRARFHRAQSVFKQRQRPRAAPLFAEAEGACRTAGDRDLHVKALYQGGRCCAAAGRPDEARTKYDEIERDFPEHSYADDARLRSAELAAEAGDEARANEILAEIPARYPQGDLLGEALFRIAFSAYQKREYDRALSTLDENITRIPHESVWYAEGRAHYWKARVYEALGMPESARAAYARAINEYPLSVYALFSFERLRERFPQARQALLRDLRKHMEHRDGLPVELAPRAIYGEPAFLRAVELARMGLGNDVRRELASAGLRTAESRNEARSERVDAGQTDALWVAAVLLDRGRVYSASHAVPRYTLTEYRRSYPQGRIEAAWRLAYPRAFPELVSKSAHTNQLPEALALAIMREESSFGPRSESFANALGLMQLLVKTAQRFSERRVTRDSLLEPATNVELGTRFVSFLLAHFNGSAPLAIASYNAGEGAIDRWLKDRGEQPLDEFIELIPYDETRNYTKRVLASYVAYTWLYDTAQPVPRISFSLKPSPEPQRQGRSDRRR